VVEGGLRRRFRDEARDSRETGKERQQRVFNRLQRPGTEIRGNRKEEQKNIVGAQNEARQGRINKSRVVP
jgi:hypothetical protein